jgi:hypothetical protein
MQVVRYTPVLSPPQLRGHARVVWQSPTMTRQDLLFWISIIWLLALCGTAIWALVAL